AVRGQAMQALSQEAEDVARANMEQELASREAALEGNRAAALTNLASPPAMVTLEGPFVDPVPLTEQDIADIEAAEAAQAQQASPFSAPLAGTVFGTFSPALAMSTTFDMPAMDPFGAFEAAHVAAQQDQAPFGSALNPE